MRNKNPFQAYQNAIVSAREVRIRTYLNELKLARTSFKYLTDLAKIIAKRITQIESEPCSYTTLLRNTRYKSQLLEFMAAAHGTRNLGRLDEPRTLARIRTLELDLGNIERENERLRAYIKDIQSRNSEVPRVLTLPDKANDDESSFIALSNERALLCKALWLILEHFQGVVSIDVERGCIIDLAAPKRKNVIVDAEIAKAFLKWLGENAWVGS